MRKYLYREIQEVGVGIYSGDTLPGFIGNFGWGEGHEGVLYKAEKIIGSSDDTCVIVRFDTEKTRGIYKPLIKLDTIKGLVYFSCYNDKTDVTLFDSKGVKLEYLNLRVKGV